MSFRDALAQLADIHTQELVNQRQLYEDRLQALHREKELVEHRLSEAMGVIAALDPASEPWAGLSGPGAATARHPAGVEAGGSAEGTAGPGLDPAAAPAAAPGATPPAAGSAALARGPPAEHSGTSPTDAIPAFTGPSQKDGSKDQPCTGPRWLWEVVGGKEKGGILVRDGECSNSQQCASRLSTGALIEEIRLVGHRLHFRRISGSGPREGWINTELQGKDLAVRAGWAPLKPRQPPPMVVGPSSEEPLPIAFFFHPNPMSKATFGNFLDLPVMKQILDRASPFIDIHCCSEGDLEVLLTLTPVGCLIGNLVALEMLRKQQPEVVRRASAMFGFGSGQLAALCATGTLSFEHALKLVLAFMDAHAQRKHSKAQCTISITGIEHEKLHLLCLQACRTEGHGAICEITLYVSPKSFYVGGTKPSIDLLSKMVEEMGARVIGIEFAAYHTSLMAPAEGKCMTGLYKALPNMRPPQHTIWLGSTAEPVRPGCDPVCIVNDLRNSITSPVLISQCTDAMRSEGINEFYHVQPATMQCTAMRPSSEADWVYMWQPPLQSSSED